MKKFFGISSSKPAQKSSTEDRSLIQNPTARVFEPSHSANLLAQSIALRITTMLIEARGPAEATDLAIAREFGARDFDTQAGGGTVRNVMTADQALAGQFLVADPLGKGGLAQSGLSALMSGRDFIALTHGEGLQARVTVILNDSANKNAPTTFLLWEEGQGCRLMPEHALLLLITSPQDRIVLGPLKHHATRTGSLGLYHEKQLRNNCGLHAMNALAGCQLVSKMSFDAFLIKHRLAFFGSEGVSEDDFYRNKPLMSDMAHLFELDSGLEPNVLEQVMKATLPGQVARFRPEPSIANHPSMVAAKLLDFADHTELHATGCVVFASGHYLAFRKAVNTDTRHPVWVKIDSLSDQQELVRPSEFLHQALDHGPCEIIAWTYHVDAEPPAPPAAAGRRWSH